MGMIKNKKFASVKKTKTKKKISRQVRETSVEYVVGINNKPNASSSQTRRKMKTLTSKELERQDFVDGEIFELINTISPTSETVDWNIEMIADVRDRIRFWLVDYYAVIVEQDFYPYIPEKSLWNKRLQKKR